MKYYTFKQVCSMMDITEHTLRYYTDKKLLPYERDGANRRIFTDESLNWLQGIKCLKGCGLSIEEIKEYVDLCLKPETKENLQARFEIILKNRDSAYQKLEEAKQLVDYMDNKVKHYESILAGEIPDDSNPADWTGENKPKFHY